MILFSLIAVMAVHFFLFRKRGLVDPVSVFFIAFLYYCYFTPVVMELFGQFDLFVLEQSIWITDETLDRVAVLNFVAYLGYAVGYRSILGDDELSRFQPANLSIGQLLGDMYLRVLLFFVVATVAVLFLFYGDSFASATESYSAKITGNYVNSTYGFLLSISLTIISVVANYLILNARNYALMTGMGLGFFLFAAFAIFSKGPFIYAALCGFCYLYRFRRIPPFLTLTAMAVVAVIMLVYFVPVFAAYRADGQLNFFARDPVALNVIYSDASGPFGIVNFALNGFVNASGYPIWDSFVLWIPRSIWPDRPYDIAEGFAREVIVGWQAGFGLGFSPLAEGYARFGMLGAALFMGFMGFVTSALQWLFGRAVPEALRVPAVLTVGGLVAVLVLRSTFSGLITQSLQNWAPLIVVSLVAREIVRRFKGPANSSLPRSPAPIARQR